MNEGWHAVFPNTQLENLAALRSYHYLILLNLEPGSKYENSWSVEPEFRVVVNKSRFRDVVKESW